MIESDQLVNTDEVSFSSSRLEAPGQIKLIVKNCLGSKLSQTARMNASSQREITWNISHSTLVTSPKCGYATKMTKCNRCDIYPHSIYHDTYHVWGLLTHNTSCRVYCIWLFFDQYVLARGEFRSKDLRHAHFKPAFRGCPLVLLPHGFQIPLLKTKRIRTRNRDHEIRSGLKVNEIPLNQACWKKKPGDRLSPER